VRPRLFVVTGPSGAGKGTLIRRLVAERPDLAVAVSATTRARRPGEENGRAYHFLSAAEFQRRVDAGDFLEHVDYVSGHRYGTLREEVDRILDSGKSVILELETHGAKEVQATLPDAVTIFIEAPTFAELERRLRARGTESAGAVGERLQLGRRQAEEAGDFDHVVTNDDVARAVAELGAIVDRALGAGKPSAAGKLSAP
jgi:guanylate kinase